MKTFAKLILAAAVLALAGPAPAQRGWSLLGSRVVDARAERDVIAIAGKRLFSEIRICVARHAVQFHDIDVRFRNGASQNVRLRSVVPLDGCTGAIRLRGGARDVERVVYAYEARGSGRRGAIVRLYGR